MDYSIVAIACNEEPLTFEDACDDPHWMCAMQSEMDSIHKNGTWELCELPKGKNVIGTKWVYKIKRKSDGSIDRYKARLVAKGYAQQYGIDYEETFAPTSRMTTIRTVVALAAQRGWKMHVMIHIGCVLCNQKWIPFIRMVLGSYVNCQKERM